ncbi:DUF3891 family protein [Bacillus sp. USDA818B3_A]|uniref:DUF3891 family protein n=1 Tax=Bacillus sp. USDA818B3_A TaxID=2698834 RepID=UPI001F410E38|nr:DUF3891 family protein [Bacillus sp. USDA818B3_A]
MIICEYEHSFIMISQHDHAKISGEIARNWRDDLFNGIDRKEDVVLSIYEHDRGWIDLDSTPLWNDQEQKPFSFENYPMEAKTTSYKKGIDEVAQSNKYAGLLCSLHFAAFFKNETDPIGKAFMKKEIKRQQCLLNELGIQGKKNKEEVLMYHLDMLRFCDNLSLFISLNKPGENAHPFFRNGFPQLFPFANNQPIHAQWTNQETVSLSISPLKKELLVHLIFKEVKKSDIRLNGLVQSYIQSPSSIRTVTFI